jgi:hypothetical protein
MRWSVFWAFAQAALLGCGGSGYGAPAYAEPPVEPESPPAHAERGPSATHGEMPAKGPAAELRGAQGSNPSTGASGSAASNAALVYVNRQKLTEPDLRELEARLGQPPQPGRYWYDERSGLWGLIGHGAGGVTKAGLRAGPLPSDASFGAPSATTGGTTGVLVNGREITRTELSVLARLLSWQAPQPGQYTGRYTLDENGELYGPANRYLGNLVQSAVRIRGASPATAQCAWLRLETKDDSLGRAVTITCD